jgi:transcriptional regulator with XRE-family HTH domain
MADGSDRGVAYDFWVRVKREQASRGWTDEELRRQSGIARTTVDRLEKGKRAPAAATVNSLATALDVDQDEAHRLARLVPDLPRSGGVSTRDAVLRDPNYTETQRQTMLELLDVFARVNEQAADADDRDRKAG